MPEGAHQECRVPYCPSYAVRKGFCEAHQRYYVDQTRGPAGANAIQFTTTPAWAGIVDAGDPATLADIAQELAFQVDGTTVPEPATMALASVGSLAMLRRRRA